MDFIKLICYCPDLDCENNRTPLEWTHTDCGRDLYLDRNANIHCYKCPSTYLILNSRFKCSKCQNWCFPKYTRLSQILSVIASFDVKKIGMDNFTKESLEKFLDDLTDNLFLKSKKNDK